MMKKRIIVPILALVLTLFVSATLFVACNDDRNPDNNTKKNSYTVTFEYNNGAENTTQTVEEGNTVQKPQDPTQNGFDFSGWVLKGQTDLYDFSTPVTSDITLSATWTAKVPENVRLRWTDGDDDGFSFVFDGATPRVVAVGSQVKFSLLISPYYAGTPVVKVDDTEITPNAENEYSFVVEKSSSIKVEGLEYDNTPMAGSGTEQDPYAITRPIHMKNVTEAINADNEAYLEAYYRLDADIDFANEVIEPIGLGEYPFLGQFDGNGHTIRNYQLDASQGYAGLFAFVAMGMISNLNVETDLVVECTNASLEVYVVGAIVAYNMGSDVTNCTFTGSIEVVSEVDPSSCMVLVGGVTGFMQGYSTTNTGTISYNTVRATLKSSGSQAIESMGGIVGAMTGTADSATAYVHNSVFDGSVSGEVKYAGGIAGSARVLSSVANCYTRGSVSARDLQNTSEDSFVAAGAIVGLAGNETAVVSSVSDATVATVGNAPSAEYIVGDLAGVIDLKARDGIDDRQSILYNSHYLGGDNAQSVDIANIEQLAGLLGWNAQEWQLVEGKVAPKYGVEPSFTLTFDFGTNMTVDTENGQEVITQDNVVLNTYIPLNWVYETSGMNAFTADNGTISYGFFLDEECTKRLPSAFMPTSDMTIYVGFADYSPVAGEYYTSIGDTNIRLVFDDKGKLTVYYKAIVENIMYAYDGEVVIIKNANFADLVYASLVAEQYLSCDYHAIIDEASGNLTIFDTLFYAPGAPLMNDVIKCNKKNDAMGTWYSTDGKTYQFLGDGTVVVSTGETYLYSVSGATVTLTSAAKTIIATLSADKTQMNTADGTTLSVKKFDEYMGAWESAFATQKFISFDGKGAVAYKEQQFTYSIDEYGVLTFENVTVTFDTDGMLVVNDGGVVTVFGREGSYIGKWSDPSYEYTVELLGINKDGYGLGFDSNGITFTYGAIVEEGNLMINLYYGSQLYGYGYYAQNTDPGTVEKPNPVGEFIMFAGYLGSGGMLIDDLMLAYYDAFEGEWNGTDGSSLNFNGLGAYDINMSFTGYDWILEGYVEVNGDANGAVRYTYDRATEKATFTYNQTEYVATLTIDGIEVNGVAYSRTDGLNNYIYTSEDGSLKLQFNGKSQSGHGKVKVTLGAETVECDYTFDGEIATITYQDQPMFTATITDAKFELSDGETAVEMFIYHSVVGKQYILASGAFFSIDTYFAMDGSATGSFAGQQVDVAYVNESYLMVNLGGMYYLQVIDEYTIAMYTDPTAGIIVASIPDGYQGEYVSATGEKLTLDGRSNSSSLIYPNAILETEAEVFNYTYEIESVDGKDVIHIYEIVESAEGKQLVEVYTAYTEQTDGSVAYTSEGGATLYLKAVAA